MENWIIKFVHQTSLNNPLDIKLNWIVIFTFSLIAMNKIFKYAGRFWIWLQPTTRLLQQTEKCFLAELSFLWKLFIDTNSYQHWMHFALIWESLLLKNLSQRRDALTEFRNFNFKRHSSMYFMSHFLFKT